GIVLNAIDIKRFKAFSMVCYLAMGWCIVFKFNLLPQTVGTCGIILLVIGGLCYTVGTLFYGLQKKQAYMHSIWHLWILAGSFVQFLCILLYVV
ncbi:MAG: PAQR family membrane homeostasis protein TrhA, partial [bacterium]